MLIALVVPVAVQAQIDKREVVARNQITSGDYSTNIIATGSSTVYVFIDEKLGRVRATKESVVAYVRTNEVNRFEKAHEKFPARSGAFIEQVAVADYVFSEGQYSLSASLYREILDEMELQDDGYNFVEGMVTASFYGSARHFDGLRFICDQYAFRPKWNYRFRHAIHAHVRALVAHLGHEQAEHILDAVRRDPRCDRADFTNVWIPIHLQDMRHLESSTPYWDFRYGISDPEDLRYAENLLQEGGHGFTDYLLFVMGRFEEVVERYPNSYIYDLALLGVGWSAEPKRAIQALVEYLERFSNSRDKAFELLLQRAEELGGDPLVAAYRARYPEEQRGYVPEYVKPFRVSDTVRIWVRNRAVKSMPRAQRDVIAEYYTSCRRFTQMFEDGDFAALEDALTRYRAIYDDTFAIDLGMSGYFNLWDEPSYDFGGVCLVDFSPVKLDAARTVVAPGAIAQRAFDDQALASVGRSLKLCGDARDRMADDYSYEPSPECQRLIDVVTASGEGVSLHRAAINILRKAFELSGRRDSRSLFLSGLAYRHIGEFELFVQTMTLYAETFPKGPFADDALTEIGWFYLTIREDTDLADRYFQRVVDEYPGENAYDNALNWLVISKRMSGDYVAALSLSTKLLATVVSDRLLPKALERHEEINFAANIVGAEPLVRIGEDPSSIFGFGIEADVGIVITASQIPDLSVGTRLYAVDGQSVTDANTFFLALENRRQAGRRTVRLNLSSSPTTIDVPIEFFTAD